MIAKPWYAQGMRRFAIANYCMAGLFFVAALLQLNDPDTLQWIALYAGALIACVSWRRHIDAWWLSAAVGVLALVWAGWLAPDVIGKVGFHEFFESMDKKGGNAEIAREFGGLLIVAGWMAALTITGYRRAGNDTSST